MNKVFVTGADGLLGSMVCRMLLEQEYEVTALCLKGSRSKTISDLPINRIEGDILDRDLLIHQVQGQDYVVHIAANTNIWPRRNPFVVQVNYDGTMNLRDACMENDVKRMIVIGSASQFSPGTLKAPGDESTDYSLGRFGMDYTDSKYRACMELLQNQKENGLPVIIVAPTFMIGPFDSLPSSGKLLISFYNKKLPGYTGGGKNFVYTGDVAKVIVAALTKGRVGESYIVGGSNMTYRDFLATASTVLNRPFKMIKIPNILIIFFGLINSVIARIRSKPPQISLGIARLSLLNQYYSSKKAQRDFEYLPTPIDEAIQLSLDWFRENKYIS